MRDATQAQGQHKAAADLWKHTLSQIHCQFGRLVYLSSLRDGNTGVYQHHGLSLVLGADQAGQTLEDSHVRCFREWLALNLKDQHADLSLYFSEQDAELKVIVGTWSRLASYRNLIPAAATATERHLFLSDLETILAMLKTEYGVEDPDPNA
ncbi:MAG: hypothetical protein ABI972_09895 [Acidobacteriota bacterium]